MNAVMHQLNACLERLSTITGSMEGMAILLKQCAEGQHENVGKITAAVEQDEGTARTKRELDLERQLARAEEMSATLQAETSKSERAVNSRKTLPAATVQLLAKQGLDVSESVDLRSLDAALNGLSVENRFAIKSQLMRTGALTIQKAL